jgi:hypothetical protein
MTQVPEICQQIERSGHFLIWNKTRRRIWALHDRRLHRQFVREVIMYVVRLRRPNEDFDFRTFDSNTAAVARLRAAQREMIDGDVEQCALFEVRAADAEAAIAMINQGKATLIESNLDSDVPLQGAARTA